MKKIINPWKNVEGYNCFGCAPHNAAGELCTEALCTYFTFPKEKAQQEMAFTTCDVEPEEVLPLI